MSEEKVTPQQQDPKSQAQQLVNEVKTSATAEPTPAADQQDQLPEGFNPEQFNQVLKQVSGIEDYTQISELKNSAETYKTQVSELQTRYQQIQQEANQLKAKANLNPFANPLVEEINSFFQENRSESEIRRFLALHTRNIEEMDYGDAVMQQMALQNPHLDENDLDILLEEKFGEIPELRDDMTDEERRGVERKRDKIFAKMKVAGKEAKEWLLQQRKSFDNPEVQQQREQQQAQLNQFSSAWGEVAQEIANVEMTLDYEIESKDFGKYTHPGFKPKLDDGQKEQLAGLLRDYAVQNRLPLNKDSLPVLEEYKQNILWNLQREEFLGSLLRDFHAEIARYYLTQSSNRTPVPQGSESRQPPPAPKKNSEFPTPSGPVGKEQFF